MQPGSITRWDDSGGKEDEEDKVRAEDEVMEDEKGRALCGFETGV